MADRIRRETGHEAELMRGWPGEFTVLVNGRAVSRRLLRIPDDDTIMARVRAAI